MLSKRFALGFVTGLAILGVGISVANLPAGLNSRLSSSEDVTYGLQLNDSNGISAIYTGSTTKSIATTSGAYNVDFSYTNVSPLTGGHCTIASGGIVVNADHILSIQSLTMNFVTSGSLRFRTSYDASTWGSYNVAVSGQVYSLSSHPYYIEFSAYNASVDLTSVSYGYTCQVNPDAEGSSGDTLLGVMDFWVADNVTNGSSNTGVSATYVDTYSFTDLAHTASADIVSSVTQSKAYTQRYGGIGIGSGSTNGTITFTLNSAFYPTKISVVGLAYEKATSTVTVTGSSATASSQSFTIQRGGVAADIDNAQTLDWSFSATQSTITIANASYNRLAIYRVLLYTEGSGSPSAPKDEVGFTATDSNASSYTVSSVYDTDNGLSASANFSDGTTSSLVKGTDYTYTIKNSSDTVVSTSSAFTTAGTYTLYVSYKSYIPVQITLTVGNDAATITAISAILATDTYTTSDTLVLTDNLLIDLTYSDSTTVENVEYANLSTYGLALSLLTPGSVDYTITSPFGTAGTWTLRVYLSSNSAIKDEISITVTAVAVTSVTITNGSSYAMEVGDTVTLVASIAPTDATNQNVSWSSSDSTVASVSEAGLVTALKAGSTNVVATSSSDSTKTATCAITVTQPASSGYKLVESTADLVVGDSYVIASNTKGMTAGAISSSVMANVSSTFASDYSSITTLGSGTIVLTLGGSSGAWTFANSSSQLLGTTAVKKMAWGSGTTTWSISIGTSSAATIASTTTSYGSLQYNSNSGQERFTTYASTQTAVQLYKLDSTPVYATSISLSSSVASIGIGETQTLTVTFDPSTTNQKTVTWTSSNSAVAGVSNGVVTGASAGTATITASVPTNSEGGTTTATCFFTVSNIAVTGVTLSPTTASIHVNGTQALTPTIAPSNATNKNVSWSSSDSGIASVSNAGVVTGVAEGNATITVTSADGNKTATCAVVVSAAVSVAKTNIEKTYTDYNDNNIYSLDNCPTSGTPKILIIPVWFTDSSTYITSTAKKANVRSDIQSAYLGTTTETGWNSVASFYDTESNGNVTLNGVVSDWYECGSASSVYYADSGSETTNLVTAATDWYFTNNTDQKKTDYDTDDDGYFDGVLLIYGAPDYSALKNDNASNLWAYCYWMQQSAGTTATPVPNVFFWASYDFMYDSSTASSRAGSSYGNGDCSHCTLDAHTFIHEMGHVFGLEDYYDYSNTYQPAGGFSMQDYNVGGHDPYSVMAYGWADPYIPTESCEITIGAFQTNRDMILLTPSWNSFNSPFDEYLLLELYTPTGLNEQDATYQYSSSYPKGPSDTGIRLWHVDARLAYGTSSSATFSASKLTTNPNISGNVVYHAMSNTYYSSSASDYISILGQSYANYNILQLIRNNTSATYTPTDELANASLFGNGSSFSMSTYASQFVQSGKLNSGTALGWSFTVSITGSGASATAKITLTKI